MLLEEKFLEFHRYASSHNLPLEAISVGDENKVLCEMHYAANAPRNIYSHTKSFTVTALNRKADNTTTAYFATKVLSNIYTQMQKLSAEIDDIAFKLINFEEEAE